MRDLKPVNSLDFGSLWPNRLWPMPRNSASGCSGRIWPKTSCAKPACFTPEMISVSTSITPYMLELPNGRSLPAALSVGGLKFVEMRIHFGSGGKRARFFHRAQHGCCESCYRGRCVNGRWRSLPRECMGGAVSGFCGLSFKPEMEQQTYLFT